MTQKDKMAAICTQVLDTELSIPQIAALLPLSMTKQIMGWLDSRQLKRLRKMDRSGARYPVWKLKPREKTLVSDRRKKVSGLTAGEAVDAVLKASFV